MKLTGLLKNKVEEAQTKEEKKAIIAEAGMELTDEELDGVAGGHEITPRPMSAEEMEIAYLRLKRRLNCTPDSGQVKDV